MKKSGIFAVLSFLVFFSIISFQPVARAQRMDGDTAHFLTALSQSTPFPPMDNGELDKPDEPFDYYSRPTTVIGALHAAHGTEITPEGYLYTGYAEMGIFAGADLKPINQRVRTLEQGYLPIVNMYFSIDGVNYDIQCFADSIDGMTDEPTVNLVMATVANPGDKPREARLGAGMRYALNLPNRAQRHMTDALDIMFFKFNPKWRYIIRPEAALRDGKIIFTYDMKPDEAFITEGKPYDFSQKHMRADNKPEDWAGIVAWRRNLAPGESFTVHFVMPFKPAEPKKLNNLRAINYEDSLVNVADSWNDWLAQGADFSVSEKKVNDTFKANLIYLAIAMDKEGENYVQKVNEFQYDSFWIRDSSFMLTAYDATGHPFEAGNGSLNFLKWQTPEGNFESQLGQLDGFGQSLWTFGYHYLITRDLDYLRKVWPAIMKSIGWLHNAREKEKARLTEGGLGYGMMPISNPGDNELVDGHVVGHDFWGMHGLNTIRLIAPDVATPEEIALLDSEIADYGKWIEYNINETVKRTGGFITPALEPGGNDWGNLKMLWPTRIFKPFDQRVTETLRMAHYKYKEGIMTYANGEYLHDYIGIDVPQNYLVRGEQADALYDFYHLLMHTGSTHGGFEWSIKPWGDRNFGTNLAPHGCFAGKYLLLYRNMLVREDGNELHLGSALSPRWLRPGDTVAVKNAPTNFGPVGYTLTVSDGGATLDINPPARNKPERIILHLPEGYDVSGVNADGKVIENPDRSNVVFSPDTTHADIKWQVRRTIPFTYKKTVENYIDVYWKLHPHDTAKGAEFEED